MIIKSYLGSKEVDGNVAIIMNLVAVGTSLELCKVNQQINYIIIIIIFIITKIRMIFQSHGVSSWNVFLLPVPVNCQVA